MKILSKFTLFVFSIAALASPSRSEPMHPLKIDAQTIVEWHLWRNDVVVGYEDGRVEVWSLDSASRIGHFEIGSPEDRQKPFVCSSPFPCIMVRTHGLTPSGSRKMEQYGLPTGESKGTSPLPAGWFVAGFNQNGDHAYAIDWYDLKAFYANCATGKQDWMIDYSDLVKDKTHLDNMPVTYFREDGLGIILLLDNHLIALDKEKKLLWDRGPVQNGRWEPVMGVGLVGMQMLVRDPDGNKLLGIDVNNGKTKWILKDVEAGAFLGASESASLIAIRSGTELHLYDPRDTEKLITVKDVDTNSEIQFSQDGRQLVIFPALSVTGTKPAAPNEIDMRKITRANSTAIIVDTTTGKEIRRIELKRSAD